MKRSNLLAFAFMIMILSAAPAMAQVGPPPKELADYSKVKERFDELGKAINASVATNMAIDNAWEQRRPLLSAELQAIGDERWNLAQSWGKATLDASSRAKKRLADAGVAILGEDFETARLALEWADAEVQCGEISNACTNIAWGFLDKVGR